LSLFFLKGEKERKKEKIHSFSQRSCLTSIGSNSAFYTVGRRVFAVKVRLNILQNLEKDINKKKKKKETNSFFQPTRPFNGASDPTLYRLQGEDGFLWTKFA
jgi:hypothetical protein